MVEKKVQCPHCNEVFNLDFPEAKLEEVKPLTKKDIEELLTRQAPDLTHRHKTADEFLDCPECRLWFDKTAKRYQVTEKKPEPSAAEKPADQPAEEKEETGKKKPAAAKPAFGSIFKQGGEHEEQQGKTG